MWYNFAILQETTRGDVLESLLSAQPIKEAMLQLTVNQLKQLVVSFFPCCWRSRDQLDREHHSLECITTTR